MRIAIHTQHFVGVGHHVRATRLARAFRQAAGSPHEVLVFDGGRPFNGAGADPVEEVGRVQLPPLVRGKAGLETCNGDQPLKAVLAERRQLLVDGLRRLQPDLIVLESFPFSRWALREEIFAGIRQARASSRAVRVVCSLRDVPRAFQERCGPDLHGWDSSRGRPWPIRTVDDRLEQLPEVLNSHFDAILLHGDPRVTRLEDHFPWVHRLCIPVHYTGYVQQEAAIRNPAPVPRATGPLVVVSVGGGVNGLQLIELATAALSELRRQPGWNDSRMVVFGGAFMSERELAAAAACRQHGAQFEAFSSEFPAWLQTADLSISRGGYNTAVALLAARVRALVFPATDVSDQTFRIHRLAELGIVITSPEGELDAGSLAALISATLDRPRPTHDLDLAGAQRTVQILTELVAERPPADRVPQQYLA